MKDLLKPYYAKKIEDVDHGKGYWKTMKIGVFNDKDEQIGSYERDYSSFFNTFEVFKQKDKWLALFSAHYETTGIMELPSCKILGENNSGFCPVDFYVPNYYIYEFDIEDKKGKKKHYKSFINQVTEETLKNGEDPDVKVEDILYHKFGFVAGCYWGDDSSWKIQKLDLSKAYKGKVKLEDTFGYAELPNGLKLKDAIDLSSYDEDDSRIMIAVQKHFYLNKKHNIECKLIQNDE